MKHPLLLLLICCGLCTAVSARPIRGTVKCGGRPLGGVAVTDGYTFAQSDAQGAFALDADDEALFISVVTPAGYIAPLKEGVPQFFLPYTPSAKRFDFELQAWPGTAACYELLAIADPQPKTDEHFERLRTEIIPPLQAATAAKKAQGVNQAAILLGDIVNTDAQLISQGLSELGINVFYQTVVGDNPARLERVVREAKDRADIIITTGGLGPTLDDLTKETLATVFGKKMVLHQPSMDRLTDFFKTIGREMTKNNEKQAWLPEGCTVFTNLWGTAPGCAFEADGKHVLMLPGPPRECNPMWKECAMPYLYKLAGGCIVSRNIRVFGLGESNMENILHDMMEKSANPTIAPYARTSECFARVTAKADTPAECEKLLDPVVDEILKLLGDDVYGVDVDSLEQVVGDGLRERKLTLAVAESCTGGLLSKRLTDIPGASDYYLGGVCSYSNSVKEKVLGVKKETLDTVGAVSPETAEQMAVGVANALGSDIGVGITGIAGPGGGTEDKPTGLVYISVWYDGKFFTRKMQSSLGRDRVRMQAASTALDLIRRHIF